VRIASLLPSATEVVCAVGARQQLVGVSHECDYPPGIGGLPALTRPRRALPRRSGDIDRAVRETVRDALSVYEVDIERLREVHPDVIVTQDLCDVCAVSLDDVCGALREIARDDVTVVSLRPIRLGDVWDDVRRVGEVLGLADRARSVAADLARRCEDIGQRATATTDPRPTVLTIEWLDPVMVGGTWMPDLVALAGGKPLVTEPGELARTMTVEQLRTIDPDVVLIKPCGFSLDRTAGEVALIRDKLPWETWKAVRGGRVFVADGSAYFNRPGPRLVESLEILAACVHEGAFREFADRHNAAVRRVGADLSLHDIRGPSKP
jgi:iron complex transport system substrate-binding protein